MVAMALPFKIEWKSNFALIKFDIVLIESKFAWIKINLSAG